MKGKYGNWELEYAGEKEWDINGIKVTNEVAGVIIHLVKNDDKMYIRNLNDTICREIHLNRDDRLYEV